MHTVIIAALLLLGTIILSGKQASAEDDIFARFKKPMPKVDLMDEREFINSTKLIRKTPYGDEALAYSMRIDKNWEEGEERSSANFMLSEKLFQNINVFFSRPSIDGRSRIEIKALNIDGNLTAEQWYLKYILEGGYTTLGFKTHSDTKIESLMIVMEQDYSFYVRTLAIINGTKVIMVNYYVPATLIDKQKVMQAQVLESFKLKNLKSRVISEMASYRFLDVAEIHYPKTWKVFAKKLNNVDRMDVSLVNVKEVPGAFGRPVSSSTEGKVDVKLVSSAVKNSLVEEVTLYKKEIEESGMLVGEKIPFEDEIKYNESIDFGITEVYKGIDSTSNLNDFELWFTVMVSGNYYYFMLLLTPSRNDSFATWAENTQNYKIMVSKFTPMVGAFLDRD